MTGLRRFLRRGLLGIRIAAVVGLLACLGGVVLCAVRIAQGSPQAFECAIALVFMVLIAAGAAAVLAFSTKAAGLLRNFERQTDNIRRWAETASLDSAEKRNEENR